MSTRNEGKEQLTFRTAIQVVRRNHLWGSRLGLRGKEQEALYSKHFYPIWFSYLLFGKNNMLNVSEKLLIFFRVSSRRKEVFVTIEQKPLAPERIRGHSSLKGQCQWLSVGFTQWRPWPCPECIVCVPLLSVSRSSSRRLPQGHPWRR